MKNRLLTFPWLVALLIASSLAGCSDDDSTTGDLTDADTAIGGSDDSSSTEEGGVPVDDASGEDAAPSDDSPDTVTEELPIEVVANFDSGSVGAIAFTDPTSLELALKDDNDDSGLPDSFRTWWFVRLDNVPVGETINVRITNRGFPYFYVPVFSYDGIEWQRMEESEVTANEFIVRFERSFEESTVWLARFYPYTHQELLSYLDSIEDSPFVHRTSIGQTVEGRAVDRITLTDPSVPDESKSRVWIHGRTHPAETGSSWVVEGLVNWLLEGSPEAQEALATLVVDIVPMHNVDGVIAGNYRTNLDSVNLENSWFLDTAEPWELLPNAPPEVVNLRDAFADSLLGPNAPPVTAALNLHSSNSEPGRPVFFFPHFGPGPLGYTADEAALWSRQVTFIDLVAEYYGRSQIEPPPAEGGSSFAQNQFPETWWWYNTGPDVMALTLETVYGRAGFDHWVTPEDIRPLGAAIGQALIEYHDQLN